MTTCDYCAKRLSLIELTEAEASVIIGALHAWSLELYGQPMQGVVVPRLVERLRAFLDGAK